MNARQTEIISQLLLSYVPIHLRQFEIQFGVSGRTIRNDITEINEILEENHFPRIHSDRRKGFSLSLDRAEKAKFQEFIGLKLDEEFLTREERVLDLLVEIAFSTSPVYLYTKEEEYGVSKSTIDEDMRVLRSLLRDYSVKIVSQPKLGVLLSGQESSIRIMLYSLISNHLSKAGNKIKQSKVLFKHFARKVKQLNQLFEEVFESRVDKLYQLNYNLFTLIWILRVRKGEHIEKNELPIGELEEDELSKQFVERVAMNFKLKEREIEKDYIFRMLQSFNLQKLSSTVNWLQLQILVVDLIRFIEQRTSIPFSHKENTLQQALFNHFIALASRVNNHIQLTNPLKEKIIENYTEIFEAMTVFKSRIEEVLESEIIDDELAFLCIHFSTILSQLNKESSYYYEAVVVCHYGIATSQLLAQTLTEFFNVEIVAILNSSEVGVIEKLNADIVFSTIELEGVTKPVLVVNSVLDENTKQQIRQFLELNQPRRRLVSNRQDYTEMLREVLTIFEKNQSVDGEVYTDLETIFKKYRLDINPREVQPMIQDILMDQNIQITSEEMVWKDSIRFTAKPLLDEEAITEHYIDEMIRTVEKYGPYIVLAPHMALAHARPEDGAKKLGLSLSIFKSPVSFGESKEQQVSVMFCLSAIDSFSHLNIMKSLVNLIRATNKIEELSKARDIQSAKTILLQE